MWNVPDEAMRYQVPQFIYKYGRLPIGYEDEVINEIWGFSYAFSPYLPSIIGAAFMKLCSLFTKDEGALLIACRMVNTFAIAFTVLFAVRAGDKHFLHKYSVYIFTAFISFMPSVLFVSGYLNNDCMSLMSAVMILDACLTGESSGWTYRSCLYIALAASLCALTYYFGYGWILFAIGYYFISITRKTRSLPKDEARKEIIRKTAFIAAGCIIFAGWYFIRNIIIYDGDMLGRAQASKCAEMYAAQGHVIHEAVPGREMGSAEYIYQWVIFSAASFIGLFGNMDIFLPFKVYKICYILMIIGIAAAVFYRKKTKLSPGMMAGLICMVLTPVGISAYNSYFSDYQPQGRYLITAIPALAAMVIWGWTVIAEAVREVIRKKRDR